MDERSWEIARTLSIVVGERTPVVERYLQAFSRAPAAHLELLASRGMRVMFAPRIVDAYASRTANQRRGRQLTASELWDLRINLSERSSVVAVYDGELDLLALPTSYVTSDLGRAVLHELGHALTMAAASPRDELLKHLPPEIDRHVARSTYTGVNARTTMRARVFEALAESYVYLVVGRAEELPSTLLSELLFILNSVEEDGHIRFSFERGFHD